MAPDSSFARPGCLPTFLPFWHATLPSYQVCFADVYALYGLWFFYSQVGSYQHIFYFDIAPLCVMPTLCVFWFWFLLFRYHDAISWNDQVWSSVYQESRGSHCWRQIIWIVQLDPCTLVYLLNWEEVCWYVSWLHVWSSWCWSHLVSVENGPGTCSYPN